jgi:hypothetical protein
MTLFAAPAVPTQLTGSEKNSDLLTEAVDAPAIWLAVNVRFYPRPGRELQSASRRTRPREISIDQYARNISGADLTGPTQTVTL